MQRQAHSLIPIHIQQKEEQVEPGGVSVTPGGSHSHHSLCIPPKLLLHVPVAGIAAKTRGVTVTTLSGTIPACAGFCGRKNPEFPEKTHQKPWETVEARLGTLRTE